MASDQNWWAERVGNETWIGHSPSGATVVMAPSEAGLPNSFTPGELLKLALAGCAGMSSEGPARRRLGDDYAATIEVRGTSHPVDDRYESFTETIRLDTSALDHAGREALVAAMTRAIDRTCTVGLTVRHGAPVTFEIADAHDQPAD